MRHPVLLAVLLIVAAPGFAADALVRIPSPGWTDELLEDLQAGLEALPPSMRVFPGGPLEIATS